MKGKELFVVDKKLPELESDKNENKVYVKISDTSYFTMTEMGTRKMRDALESCLDKLQKKGIRT